MRAAPEAEANEWIYLVLLWRGRGRRAANLHHPRFLLLVTALLPFLAAFSAATMPQTFVFTNAPNRPGGLKVAFLGKRCVVL